MQHLSNVDNARKKAFEIGPTDHSEIESKLCVAFRFRDRRQRVAEKASKLTPTRMCAALDNIRGDGHRSSDELIPQRCAGNAAHSCRDSMGLDRKFLSCLPHAELSEVAHWQKVARHWPWPTSVGIANNDSALLFVSSVGAGSGQRAAGNGQRAVWELSAWTCKRKRRPIDWAAFFQTA